MTRPLASWLRECFPAIAPTPAFGPWGGDACWIAITMTMSAEHNPPLYWLGRAFHVIAEGGAGEALRARLHAAHGEAACGGDLERDEAVQDVLSAACAYAWARTYLGPPQFEEAECAQLFVPSVDARILPVRLRPQRSMREVIEAVALTTRTAASSLPAAAGRIVYLDTWHDPRYAQGVGYRLELTEPVQHALQHLAAEHGLGHVLTRPFQWGNAIDARY